ncbi:hypothetical protein SISNIDRAFT_399029, partial [Sistotremastrum niveocremeum HHB9708]
QVFSSDTIPCLWRALPAFEKLQTAWERKIEMPQYVLYKAGLEAGLAKLNKYYRQFDAKPLYVLALVLHPYYKLEYIKDKWGGKAEQLEEIARGNLDAKDWQAEARRIVEEAVR